MRLGLGCMRLSTDPGVPEAVAESTLVAALDLGVTLLDTARAYARDASSLGDNEALIARVLKARARGADSVRIVTKGGMRRPAGRWEPDGRARAVREDCEASLAALGGLPIDLYLLHAPDPRVPWATSVRALAALLDSGLVRGIGVSNVNRRQLDEALALAPLAAVEVAFGPYAETALRGGVIGRCVEAGIEVLAHSPLGGPARAGKLSHDPVLARIASRHGVTAQRVALAAIQDLHPRVVPLVGARSPETVRAATASIALDGEDRRLLAERFGWREILSPTASREATPGDAPEVVLVMGVQGSGKSTAARDWVERGYARLNRDARGGTMVALHRALEELLREGARRVVADNTYATRAARQVAIEASRRHGARVFGVWLDTPLVEAQTNVILRMLEAHGRLLEPEEMARSKDPSSIGPGALSRMLRALEPPEADEGFSTLEHRAFVRRPVGGEGRAAEFIAVEAGERGVRPSVDLALFFGWRPGLSAGEEERLGLAFGAETRVCRHPGGPPSCWCRPPLPGLLLAFGLRRGVDFRRSVVVGTKSVHATLARAIGADYRDVGAG